MNLDDFVKEYGLLQNEEGRYYYLNERGEKKEPYCTIPALSLLLNLSIPAIRKRAEKLKFVLVRKRMAGVLKSYNFNDAIIACSDLRDDILLITDKHGWAEKDGQLYASLNIISQKLGIASSTIKKHIKNLVSLKGKVWNGRVVDLYNYNQVKLNCTDLIGDDILMADKDGILRHNGEEYAAISRIAKELNISATTLTRKVENSKTSSLHYKTWNGITLNGYNIQQIKILFPELFDELPIANENDMILYKGKKYATLKTLEKRLGISKRAMKIRVKKKTLSSKNFRARNGNIAEGYCENDVIAACRDLLDDLPKINDEGIAIVNGEPYALIPHLAKMLGLTSPAIIVRIKRDKIPKEKAKLRNNRAVDVYNIRQAEQACSDLLDHNLLIANRDGFAINNGKTYATIKAIADILKLSSSTVRSRLKNEPSVKGKILGHLTALYDLEKAKELCACYLDDNLLIANADGFAYIDNQKYAPLHVILQVLNISYDLLIPRIKHISPLDGKHRGGGITDFYNFEEVKTACADLLEKRRKTKK
jgi:DNA-binding Lrp family transcriptional regulator